MRKIDILEHEYIGGGPAWSELWIGCIDGPALPEMSGRLVYRNAGALVAGTDLSLLAAIEIAIAEYGIERIVICGHLGCRCLDGRRMGIAGQWLLPARTSANPRRLPPAELRSDERPGSRVEAIVLEQVRSTADTSVVRDAVAKGRPMEIDGMIYDPKRDEFRKVCSIDLGDACRTPEVDPEHLSTAA